MTLPKGLAIKPILIGSNLSIRQKLITHINYLLIVEDFKMPYRQEMSLKNIPVYKFYTKLIVTLIGYSRQKGTPVRQLLSSIKKGIIADDKFERKSQQNLYSADFQFLIIAIVTWIFIFLTSNQSFLNDHSHTNDSGNSGQLYNDKANYIGIVNDSSSIEVTSAIDTASIFSFSTIGLIVICQLTGIILFHYTFYSFKKMKLKIYADYLEGLYTLQSLLAAKVPLPETMKESGLFTLIQQKFPSKTPIFTRFAQSTINHHIHQRVLIILEMAQKVGPHFGNEMEETINEVWYAQEEAQQQLLQVLGALKLAITAIFYLGPHFYFLFLLFSTHLTW